MVAWSELRIAVVGGDEREAEIARLAAQTSAEVTAYGFPGLGEGIEGVMDAPSAAAALRGARYALFPIPGIAEDGSIFAPAASQPIVPDEALLSEMADGGAIILGAADQRLRSATARLGLRLSEYESDRELMLRRAPAIVEGVLEQAIARTEVSIHAARVVVIGHGTIGAHLARVLIALGARVHVAARSPVQRASAYGFGAEPLPLEQLPDLAERLEMVFSTVPARIVGRPVLERLPRGTLVMDLGAPPGGVDIELARELGHVAVWVRGLGSRAPVTVGRSQWQGIRKRIEQLEEEPR